MENLHLIASVRLNKSLVESFVLLRLLMRICTKVWLDLSMFLGVSYGQH